MPSSRRGNDMRRHGIEQFVGHHGTGKTFRQAIQPFDAGQQVRRCGSNRLLLPLAQISRQIEYAVALGQAAQPLQFEQQVGRQAAGASPHLKHRGDEAASTGLTCLASARPNRADISGR